MKRITRREFIERLSLGAAGAYAALHAPAAGGRASAGERIIPEAPVAAPFPELPEAVNESETPGVARISLTARPAPVNIDGRMANLLVYNGSFPGPVIRVRRGDRLDVLLVNALPPMEDNVLGYDRDVTNLHLHGLHVTPAWNSDNPLLMFSSGQSFHYSFDCSALEPGTLAFYRPGSHGSSAEQLWGGMAGAIVVEDENDLLAPYETHVLILKDSTLRGGAPEPHASARDWLHGKTGEFVTVNGRVNPVLPIRPGQVQRWRILNACNARIFKLSLERHVLRVIGTDGGLLDKPYPLRTLVVAPGERLDVLVKADQGAKTHRLLTLPYNRGNGVKTAEAALLTLAYRGAPLNNALPEAINPNARRFAAAPDKSERIELTVEKGRAGINGATFSGGDGFTIESETGTTELWELVNRTGMDQPFHTAVNVFQVSSLTGGDGSYASFYTRAPAWKDTVLVPRWGSARILVAVRDFPGLALIRGGSAELADAGMAGLWDIAERGAGEVEP